MGLSSLMRMETPSTFMVSQLDMKFLRPARIDDRLEVRTLVTEARGARIACVQSIMRGNEVLLEAFVENVCVSMDGRPRRLPRLLAERIAPYLPGVVATANDAAPALVAAQ
jgi:acyl-CoA thioester hydrolase